MASERSFWSTTLSLRKKLTMPSTCWANPGLCSSMLNGPRIWPKVAMTPSTTAWCWAGTSDLPVMGATLGIWRLLFGVRCGWPGGVPLPGAVGEDGRAVAAALSEGPVEIMDAQRHGSRLAVAGRVPVDLHQGYDAARGARHVGDQGLAAHRMVLLRDSRRAARTCPRPR